MQTSQFDWLAQSPAGLFRWLKDIYPDFSNPQIAITRVQSDLTHLRMPPGVHHGTRITAGGTGLTHSYAHVCGIAEAVERYCTSVYTDDQFVLATAEALDGECINLDLIPKCSSSELTNPRCPIVQPRKDQPIRWVKSVSLCDGTVRFLPAVMVYSHLRDLLPAERFWFPISTGCAAHVDLNEAIFNAICEVIERDAIVLTWLHELQLPRILIDCIPEDLAPYWNLYHRSSSSVHFEFFDATLDSGVPTVYGLRIANDSRYFRTLVGCSTAPTISLAIGKVFRDLNSLGMAFRGIPQYPGEFSDFRDMLHGAGYMADATREGAFSFLRNTTKQRSLSKVIDEQTVPLTLALLLERLFALGMTPFLVNLTTDEAKSVGMVVIRAVIPQLQPLSFHYLGRYLGHPRLYRTVFPTGQLSRAEHELNPLPQPFA